MKQVQIHKPKAIKTEKPSPRDPGEGLDLRTPSGRATKN